MSLHITFILYILYIITYHIYIIHIIYHNNSEGAQQTVIFSPLCPLSKISGYLASLSFLLLCPLHPLVKNPEITTDKKK